MFRIRHGPEAAAVLRALRAYDRAWLLRAMRIHLQTEPLTMTGPRKTIALEDGRTFQQLRVGEHRVFYTVDAATREVLVREVRYKGRKTTREIL